jgi:hypothetical protein
MLNSARESKMMEAVVLLLRKKEELRSLGNFERCLFLLFPFDTFLVTPPNNPNVNSAYLPPPIAEIQKNAAVDTMTIKAQKNDQPVVIDKDLCSSCMHCLSADNLLQYQTFT